jgi:putative ABC transport system substrate-binding protein
MTPARTPLRSSRGRTAPIAGGDSGCGATARAAPCGLAAAATAVAVLSPCRREPREPRRAGWLWKVRRRDLIALLAAAVARPLLAHAQHAGPIHRIGFLRLGTPPQSHLDAFEDGLRALGYRPGDTLLIEQRVADDAASLPALARDLAVTGADVIVASSTLAALAAKQTTSTIPIVFVAVSDPVEAGLVATLVRPGGNATGLGFIATDLTGKRLQLLSEVLPISCIAVIANAGYPTNPPQIEGARRAAGLGNIRIELSDVADANGFERAYAAAKDCGAVLQLDAPLFTALRRRLVELAALNRLPTIYGLREYPEAGGLISYGVDMREHYRRAAAYVDKILKGARPAELPVELPDKLELVINLKTAQALGLTVPPSLLARADEVIE